MGTRATLGSYSRDDMDEAEDDDDGNDRPVGTYGSVDASKIGG